MPPPPIHTSTIVAKWLQDNNLWIFGPINIKLDLFYLNEI